MRFDPPQILAEIYRVRRNRSCFRPVLERPRLLDDQPVKLSEPIGVELLPRIEPLQSALIDHGA